MAQALQAMARVLGVLWTLPNTLLGLVAGAAGLAFGAHVHLRRRELALVFHRMPWGPGGALTLGNVILHTGESLDAPCTTYAHRAGHAPAEVSLLNRYACHARSGCSLTQASPVPR